MSLHVITHYVKIEFSIRKFPKESGKFFTARFQISRFHEKISAAVDKISSLLRTPRLSLLGTFAYIVLWV